MAALLVALLLVACDPTLFKKPVQDFKDANQTLRDAYFLQLAVARDAHVERFTVQRKQQLWRNAAIVKDSQRVQEIVDAIVKRQAEDDLDRDWVRLRVRAFDAIDAYAGVLLALASNEDTDAIVAEMNGLVGDLRGLLDLVKTTESLGKVKFVGGTVEKAAGWVNGLSVAVAAFNQVITIIANVARSKAIVDTIVAADPAVIELLTVLGEEAAFAQAEAKTQYAATITFLQERVQGPLVDDAARREVAERLVDLQTKHRRLQTLDDLDRAFSLAKAAQAALIRKAARPDYQDLLTHVRSFKQQTTAIKQSLEAVRNGR